MSCAYIGPLPMRLRYDQDMRRAKQVACPKCRRVIRLGDNLNFPKHLSEREMYARMQAKLKQAEYRAFSKVILTRNVAQRRVTAREKRPGRNYTNEPPDSRNALKSLPYVD